MRKSNYLLILFSIICLLSIFHAKDGKKKQIETDDTSEPTVKHTLKTKQTLIIENIPEKFKIKTSEYKAFLFSLKNNTQLNNEKLLLSINVHSQSAVKIDIRKSSNPQEIFQSCTDLAKPCLIAQSNLINETSVLFKINCMELNSECNGTIQIKFKDQNEIELNKAVLKRFITQREEVYNFKVNEKNIYQRYLLKLTFLNQHQMKNPVPIKVSLGEYLKASEVKNAKSGNVQLLSFIIKGDNRTQEAYDYSFNLTSPKGALIEIKILAFHGNETEIQLGQDVYDFSYESRNNNYFVQIPSYPNTTNYYLQFYLKTVSGDYKSIFVDGSDKSYDDFSTYKWIINNQDEKTVANDYTQFLTLEKTDIDNYMGSNRTYHIVITGGQGIFQLNVKLSRTLLARLPIGQSVKDKMNPGDIKLYELLVYKPTSKTLNMNDSVAIDLQFSTGAGNLYGQACETSSNECASKLLHSLQSNETTNYTFSLTSIGQHQVEFHPQNCISSNLLYCIYIVGIVEKASSSNAAKYVLLAKQPNSLVDMPLNYPIDSFIREGKQNFYRLWILNDKDLKQIRIRINTELNFYLSSDITCEINEPCITSTGNKFNPIIINPDEQASQDIFEYKIIVDGIKQTHYSLIAETSQTDVQDIIELWEGIPVYDHMPIISTTKKIYQFELNLKKKEIIHLNLVSPKNQIEMIVTQNNKTSWVSNNGYLELKPKDKGYKINGIYTVTLNGPGFVEYELVYTTEQTVKKIEKNVLEYSTVAKQSQKYFSITFERAIKQMDINYFLSSEYDQFDNSKNQLKVFISNEPYQLKDTIENQQREMYFSDGKSVLNKDTLKSLCINEKKYLCTLYITVQNTGNDDEPTKFGLQVNINNKFTKLMDGVEAKFAFSEIDSVIKRFYYLPIIKQRTNKLYITVGSMLGVMTNVTVRIFENGQLFIHKWGKFKSLKAISILSTNRQSHSIEISSKILQQYQNCLIVVSVITTSKEATNELSVDIVKQISALNDFGYIIIESAVVQLVTNRNVQFNIKKDQVRYFEYKLSKVLQQNSSIVISLSEFYGHGMLAIQENNDTFHKIPKDYTNAKWLSYSGNIVIQSKDIESKADSNPKLVIGVSSSNSEAGKFIISAMNKALSRISYNQPQEIAIGKKATRYFSYISYYGGFSSELTQSFSIKLSKYFGKGRLSLIKCSTYDEVQCLQSKKKESIEAMAFTQQEAQVVLTQSNQCYGCLYLIKVVAEEEIKGTLIVQLEGVPLIMEPNKQITDTLDSNEERIYQMYLPEKEEVQIILGSLSGDLKLSASLDPFSSQQNFNYIGKPKPDNQNFLVISLTAVEFEEQKNTVYSFLDSIKEVYLTIKIIGTKQQSKYSLIVQTSEQFKILSNGVFTSFDIAPNKTVELLYHSDLTNVSQPIQFFIQNVYDSPTAKAFSNKLEIVSMHQAQPNFFGTIDPEKVTEIESIKNVATKSSIEFFIPQKKGVYIISVQNIDNDTLSISAMVTNRNLQLLPYNFKISHLLNPLQNQYYEIFAPSKGVIALELMMCSGFAEIYTTSTYEQLLDDDQHQEIKVHNEFFNLIPVEKAGPVFLGLTSLAVADSDDDISPEFYELQIYFYRREIDIPQTHFIMSNDAQISYEETNSNKSHHVIIDLPPLKCSKCGKFTQDSAFVDYKMYLGRTQEQLESNGVCVYMMSDDNYTQPKKSYQKLVEHMPLKTSEEVEDIRFKFTVPIQDKYYVMAKATITGLIGKNNTQYEPFVVYYDPIEVNVNNPEDIEGNILVTFLHPSILQVVFWLIVVFGILFVLLMIAKIISKRGGEEKQRLMKGEKSHLIKVLDSEGQGPAESFQNNQDAYEEDIQNEQKVKAKISEKYSQFYQPETILE